MKKIITILLSLFVLNVFAGKQVFSDPVIINVDGLVAHSRTIAINGTGFMEKDVATPLKYDDFENGTNNNDLSGWVFSTSSNINPVYSNDFQRKTGTKCAKAQFPGNQYLSSFGIRDMESGYDEVYVDFWYLYSPASTPSRNHKIFRWYTGYDYGHPDFYMQTFCNLNGGWLLESDGAGDSKWYGNNWKIADSVGTWTHIQGYMRLNTGGNSDGNLQFWINCIPEENSTTWKFKNASDPIWHSLWFGNYLGHDAAAGCPASPGDSYTYWDNVYIDNTRARVELGNNIHYNNCTHREIQIPLEWSNDSVKVRVNASSFSNNDVAYLFVVDKDGNINYQGYPVTIGSSNVSSTDNPPDINILLPTAENTYTASENSIILSGVASDDTSISRIVWSNNQGGNGSAINESGDWTAWSTSNINLTSGENIITVNATDSNNQVAYDSISINYIQNDAYLAWSAVNQTGDSNWKNSIVTYCVRLLVEGEEIHHSGDRIILGFKGRSSGDYIISKVSIAERDRTSNEGNVVDATWTRVTFDGKSENSWLTETVKVPEYREKLSDEISFNIQEGKDYYVTFKINSPSVYLNPPSSYRELYFFDTDHAEDVDWYETGYSSTQDYHALSSIYIRNDISHPVSDAPRPPTNLKVQLTK